MGWLLKKEGFVCQENMSTCNNSWRTVLSFRLLLSLRCVLDNKLTLLISGSGFGCNVMDSYLSLLDLSFIENYHISIFTTFAKKQWLIDYQIPLIVIARQPKFQRLWALLQRVHFEKKNATQHQRTTTQRMPPTNCILFWRQMWVWLPALFQVNKGLRNLCLGGTFVLCLRIEYFWLDFAQSWSWPGQASLTVRYE